MTVSSETASISYAGDDVTVAFAIPFNFLANSDIQVATRDSAGDATVISTGFTITGAGSGSGTCTFTTAPASGTTVSIRRDPAILQPVDYVANDAFPAETHERALDRLTYIAQRHQYELSKCLSFPDADIAVGDAELDTASTRKGKYLRFNSSTGAPEVAEITTTGTVLSASVIGGYLFPRTDEEIAASVTPEAYQCPPGDFRRYGAVGDGTTDDTDAVAAAINQALEGGALPFGQPGATYLLDTWAAIDTTAAFRLGGSNYVLKGPSSRVDFARPGGTVEADGVTFNRWLSVLERENTDTGTVAINMDRFRFEDTTGIALNIERPISKFRLTNGTIENTDGGYAIRIGRNTYAEQDNWADGLIFAVDFTDIDGSSSSSTSSAIVYGKRSAIIGCTVDGISQTGTGEAWGFYTKLRWGTVAFNKIANVDSAGSSDVTGITMKGDTRGSTSSPQGYGSLVFGNVLAFIGSTSGTQRGSGVRMQCDECYAAFNVIEDAYLNGVVMDEPDGDNTGSFFNRIRFTTASGTFGVRMSQGGSGVRSFGDEITNAETGVRLSAGAGSVDADAMVVAHDVINATVDAIQVNTSGAGDIDGLHIINNVVPSATTGLRFSGGTVTNFRALDNDFRGATTQFAGTIPADCEIRHTFRGQTTDASATDLISLTLSDDAAYRVRIEVVAVQSGGGNRNDYHRSALVYRDGGNATLQGSVIDIETPRESAAGWDCTLAVTGNTVVVRATGALATSINWKVHLHIIGTD